MQNNNAVHPNLTKTPVFFLKCRKPIKTLGYLSFSQDPINHSKAMQICSFQVNLSMDLIQYHTYRVSK